MSEANVNPAVGSPPASQRLESERLRRSALALEGLFVSQLMRAMRDTVPENQITGGGAGEELFTAMLDEHLAAEAPARWRHGMGEALYQQLQKKMGPPGTPGAAGTTGRDDAR